MPKTEEREPLCCCEYVNAAGEHSHVLTLCCDCQDFDLICDRCVRCQPVPWQLFDRFLSVVDDRVRLPGLCGRGALKIKWDLVFLLLLPAGFAVASLSSFATFVVAMFYCGFLFSSSCICTIRARRTKLFYRWTLVSAVQLFYTFEILVIAYRKIAMWENLVFCTFVALTFVFSYQARSNANLLACSRSNASSSRRKPSMDFARLQRNGAKSCNHFSQSNNTSETPSTRACNSSSADDGCSNVEEQVISRSDEGPSSKLLETGSAVNGSAMVWCDRCQVHKVSSTEHCLLCEACVLRRDHHSAWLDCCIGSKNRRSYMAALLCGMLATLYGSVLTVNCVCMPNIYWDWFLIPADCSHVYADFMSSLCWVTCLYSASLGVFFGLSLVVQCFLVTLNMTWQEFQVARSRGASFWSLVFCSKSARSMLSHWKSFVSV